MIRPGFQASYTIIQSLVSALHTRAQAGCLPGCLIRIASFGVLAGYPMLGNHAASGVGAGSHWVM